MALLGGKKDEAPSKPLFKREEDFVSTRPGEVHTLLGKGSEFEGKLSFEGQVRIDGKFKGQIITKDVLVIGDGAQVNGDIQAGTVIINGTVEGNVRATQLIELKATGQIRGDIESPALTMERGASFDGNSKMRSQGKGGGNPPAPGEKK
ncbi:hypothetical protein KH5H1_68130 [Corallococcus caeni]|uniref:Polymer-forming cytoskeletal protein n=2 Tax=Corallococcus TaxID=83461 RepID=A0A7Y4NI94_9BACT|nr:polymer-forming cytoskeletal protein [Corallococcus exercitus]GMU02693.1 hypothetical protein KH5H1_68130 [Corallococcus sp. KH5-1]GMU10756.1 hypothetical protein ASNO1_70100 [Corallococcus sp. NO1]